jgi:hypothetical protein
MRSADVRWRLDAMQRRQANGEAPLEPPGEASAGGRDQYFPTRAHVWDRFRAFVLHLFHCQVVAAAS